MARIRTVKPEFWTDRRVGECSPNARLLFIATWNFADDHGGLDRSAKQLKAQGYRFVGPASVYAFMQNVGIVNDHVRGCFRAIDNRSARFSTGTATRA